MNMESLTNIANVFSTHVIDNIIDSKEASLSTDPKSFKNKYPPLQRRAEALRIIDKYPNRVPIIVESSNDSDIGVLDKKKYLVPNDLTLGQFVYVIRKRLKLPPEKALYMFVDNTIPSSASLMSSIYEEYKDEDHFMYITISSENTFG